VTAYALNLRTAADNYARAFFPACDRVTARFAEHNVTPSSRTRAAALTFELWGFGQSPGCLPISHGDIHTWLKEIYAGESTARVLKNGDVVLRARKRRNRNDD
jgi:hypothetical protein